MSLERVIWDVSGTIWDDLDQVFHANKKVLNDHGITHYTYESGEKVEITVDWLKANPEATASAMFRKCGMTGKTDQELQDLYQEALKDTIETYPVEAPYEGIEEVLDYLQNSNVELLVISSHPVERLHSDFARLGLDKYFKGTHIIGGCPSGDVKTVKIQTYLASRGIIGRPDSNTAYIGDTASDMAAANNAGIVSIGVTYGYQPDKVGEADYVVDNPNELRGLLKGLVEPVDGEGNPSHSPNQSSSSLLYSTDSRTSNSAMLTSSRISLS